MSGRIFASAAAAVLLLGLSAFLLRPRETPAPARDAAPTGGAVSPTRDSTEDTTRIDRMDDGAISFFGSVTPGERASLSVRMPARITAVFVRHGDSVRRGQALVQLDTSDLHAQVLVSQAAVLAAQAQLRKAITGRDAQVMKASSDADAALAGLQAAEAKEQQAAIAGSAARDENMADLEGAKENVRKAEMGLERAEQTIRQLDELAKVGGVSRSDLEGARMQVAAARADLEAARVQVRRLEATPPNDHAAPYRVALAQKDVDAATIGKRQARDAWLTARQYKSEAARLADQDVHAAEAAVEQARAAAAGARVAEEQGRLTSPIDGVAAGVDARPGEMAQPGFPLISVVSLNDLRVDALAPARQLSRLRLGQSCVITADTDPGRSFPGFIRSIAKAAEPDGRSFRITFGFRRATPLRPDQSVRITVVTR